MQPGTHEKTLIAILRDYVEEWRKANGWSRESVAAEIVTAHAALGAPRTTGIVFDPPTRDTFERMRVNADRIFRWLDDVTKDRNHLPANFIPSILYALPLPMRMHAVDDVLRQLGLGYRELGWMGLRDENVCGLRGLGNNASRRLGVACSSSPLLSTRPVCRTWPSSTIQHGRSSRLSGCGVAIKAIRVPAWIMFSPTLATGWVR